MLKGIKKNVAVLGIASFFTDISSEMLYPIIPIFLTSVLGAPMSIVGLIEGIAESTASVLKAFSGWFSDKVGKRRPFVIIGYSLSSLAKPILFLSYVWPTVLAARFIDRFGKGIRTSARDALIADSTDVDYRGKAFGFHRAMDTLGACIGPLLAIWFLAIFKENLRPIFLIAFIPALLTVLTLIFFLKREPPLSKPAENILKFDFVRSLSPDFKKFLFISSLFAIGNSSDAFLVMRAKGMGLSTSLVILAYVLYNASYSVLSTPFGILSDRLSRKSVIIIGYLVFAAVYIGFGSLASSGMVWPLFAIYGFYMAMTEGVGKAFVVDLVESRYRGTALGLYHCITGILTFFASLAAGLLWTHIGAAAPFLYGALMAVISCIAFLILMRRTPRSTA